MQGEWDVGKLFEMSEMFDLSMEEMGFSEVEASLLFDGDERFTELFETPEATGEKDKLKDIKAARKNMVSDYHEEGRTDYMVMVVFKDAKERADFMRRIHVPNYEQYITVDQVNRLLALDT